MSGADARKPVAREELLNIREQPWRKRLAVVSLAAEALDAILVPYREQALSAFGVLYRRQRKRDPEWANRRRLLTGCERLVPERFAKMWNALLHAYT